MDFDELYDDALLKEIGRRLQTHRLQARLKQSTLADQARISRTTLSKLEQGKPVRLPEFLEVLRALGLLSLLDQAIPDPGDSPLVTLAKQKKSLVSRIRSESPASKGVEESVDRHVSIRWPDEEG